jgi:hypothetical protein
MLIDPKRHAELIATLETTGLHYHALGVAGARKAATSVEGTTTGELAAIAAAKAAWEVADKELADYRASKLWSGTHHSD